MYVTTIVFITRLLSARCLEATSARRAGAPLNHAEFNSRAARGRRLFKAFSLYRCAEPVAHCGIVLESSHSANPGRIFFEPRERRTPRIFRTRFGGVLKAYE